MKTQIKIPDTVTDMNLSHLPFYLALAGLKPKEGPISPTLIEDMDMLEVSNLNCLFFSGNQGDFDIYNDASNRRILNEIILSCSRYKSKPFDPEIEVDGVTYVFQDDYSKQPVSFHRDVSLVDFEENPMDLVAFCYVEKGMMYNELDDKTKAILNPRKDRAKILEKHFTSLSLYLDLQGFFLDSYSVFRPYLRVKEERAKLKNGTGKKV